MTKYTILLYHGVLPDDFKSGLCNSSGKHIKHQQFHDQMKWLSENCPIISMSELRQAYLGNTKIPEDAVAVNFDDGFLNNYQVAWPVLEEFQVQATIYLATGFIGTGQMIWSDRLETALINTVEPIITADLNGVRKQWRLDSPSDRLAAFTSLKSACKAISNEEKDKLILSVEEQARLKPDHNGTLYGFMNWDHIRQMDASPLIEFGGHTVDHVSLGLVSIDEMQRQIDRSLNTISEELGRECRQFSYPEGQAQDFNQDVINHLKRRNIIISPSAIHGHNYFPDTDPFYIRRIMVGFENQPFPFNF